MLLPTTFPTARPGEPESTDRIVTANSGAEVAKDTTVNPTTNGDIPSAVAMFPAPRTRTSPPATSNTRPPRMSSAVTAEA